MTKAELEQAYDRVCKENDALCSILYDIKKVMVPAAETFERDFAEDTPYNRGVKQALFVISETINSKLQPSSWLYCPTFKNQLEDHQPAFTIIEGGLSKKKKKESDNG